MPEIDIIGVMLDKGASMDGCALGPKAIRSAGLHKALKQLNVNFNDYPDIKLTEHNTRAVSYKTLNNLYAINNINIQLYKAVSESLNGRRFPLILGGDHSLATGSIMAAQKYYSNIGVIWIDAHGDFNNEFSTPSGNIHGMPLSAITGNGPDLLLPFKESQAYINPKNSVIIAGRAFDAEEKIRIKNAGVTVFSMDDIDKEGIYAVVRKATDIASSGTNGLYLSFDIDALDASIVSGVGTPEMGGLTFRESLTICEYLHLSNKLVGAEMVELNPLHDIDNKTATIAVKLISSLLGKSRT